MALGDPKHRRQVQDLFQDIKQSLADCIFCYAAQSGLPKADTMRLLDHLSKVKPGDASKAGTIDSTTLTLLMALLYSVDISALHKVGHQIYYRRKGIQRILRNQKMTSTILSRLIPVKRPMVPPEICLMTQLQCCKLHNYLKS